MAHFRPKSHKYCQKSGIFRDFVALQQLSKSIEIQHFCCKLAHFWPIMSKITLKSWKNHGFMVILSPKWEISWIFQSITLFQKIIYFYVICRKLSVFWCKITLFHLKMRDLARIQRKIYDISHEFAINSSFSHHFMDISSISDRCKVFHFTSNLRILQQNK